MSRVSWAIRVAPLLGQVVQRPHVVQPVGQLDEDDPDVVHHRQQHLAEALGLPLLARRELQARQLGHALDDVGDLFAEQLADLLDGVRRVLDDVVEQAGGDRDDVQPQVGQDVGHLERVDQVGLSRPPDLALVLVGGEHVGPPEQLGVGLGIGRAHFLDEVLEPDHGGRCLTESSGGTPVARVGDVAQAGRAPPAS